MFTALALVNGTIFVPLMLHRPKDSRNGLLPSWGVRECCRLLLGVTYEVRGHENILPEGQGCVLLMNHQTALDLLVMANIWRYTPNGRMIAKKEILWLVPFGPATWFWGTVFLDRLNPEKSHKTLNRTGELINGDKIIEEYETMRLD
ncbi:hypothetical protein B566_EDAN006314 [Ephemera danica]|nr:hypothetical protein B566_EDAN006314 [Ephemera danica]